MSGSIVLPLESRLSPRKRRESLQKIFGHNCTLRRTDRGLEVSTTISQALAQLRFALGPTARIHQVRIAGLTETQVRVKEKGVEMVAGSIIGENWARLLGMVLLRQSFPEYPWLPSAWTTSCGRT